jgi:hypothetical protein
MSNRMNDVINFIFDKVIEDISKEGYNSVLGHANNCISVSVFSAKLLTLFGFEAETVESCAAIVPDTSNLIGDRIAAHGVGAVFLNADGWHGHAVVHLPEECKIIDFTLCYQNEPAKGMLSQMIADDKKDPNKPYYFAEDITVTRPEICIH